MTKEGIGKYGGGPMRALLAACMAAFLLPAFAFPKAASVSCASLLDSLETLAAEGGSDFLAWDLEGHGCSPAQLYRGYLRQGSALSMAESWESAVHVLSLAKAIGGPDDEELLYHLWTALRRLDRRKEMVAAAKELYARYPASPYLALVLEDWRGDRPPRAAAARPWKASFESRFARSKVGALDNVQSNRLRAEAGQALGAHGFRESVSASLKSRPGSRLMDAFQADLGAEWIWRGFSLEAGWGVGYDARSSGDTLLEVLSGSGSGARWSGWNGRLASLAAAWTGAPGEGTSLAARVDARLHSRNWWSAGASLAPAWFSGDWSAAVLLDWREHAMRWEFAQTEVLEGGEPVELAYLVDAMRAVQASVTPAWRSGAQQLSLGLVYGMARAGSRFRISFDGAVDEERDIDWEHSIVLSPGWRYAWRKRLRFDAGMSFGYDFGEKPAAATPACAGWLPGYCADETWSADAGLSIAF